MINDQQSYFSNDNHKLQNITSDELNSNLNSNLEYLNEKNDIEKEKDKKNNKKNIQIIDNNNNNNRINSNFKLSRNVRWFIFVILLLISIMVNMDHGTIPAATLEIKESLNAGDDVLGVFGSLVFFGNILGKIIIILIKINNYYY
jgi:hypothetical protein